MLDFVLAKGKDIQNSPAKVAAAIDEFARKQKYLMNIGEDKGRIVCDLIAEVKPRIMVELGGYVGYSSVIFGDVFRKAGGQKYFTLEHNKEFARVISSIVELAGLNDVVETIHGESDEILKSLHSNGRLEHVDLLFIDHTAFERDLKLCERLRLLSKGSVIAADNCIYPGHPEYLEYVFSSVEKKRKLSKDMDIEETGNPNLVFESKLVHSFEPSGEKVSLHTHEH